MLRWMVFFVAFIVSGCATTPLTALTAKSLTPEQIDSVRKLVEIDNVQGCTTFNIQGGIPVVAGAGQATLCFGIKEPLTVDDIVQLNNGISVMVNAPRQ